MGAVDPFFCVALRRGDGKWIIEAKWPDDATEIVETFDDYFEALRWLNASRRRGQRNEKLHNKTSGQSGVRRPGYLGRGYQSNQGSRAA